MPSLISTTTTTEQCCFPTLLPTRRHPQVYIIPRTAVTRRRLPCPVERARAEGLAAAEGTPPPTKKTKTNSNTSVTTISPPSNSFLALYARWSLHINTLALALSLLSKIIERAMERKKKEAWLHITSWQRRTALVYHWPPTVGVSISICSMTAHTHHVHRGQTSNSTHSPDCTGHRGSVTISRENSGCT